MMQMSLLEQLRERDLLEYGSVFPASLIRQLLGLEVPVMATFKEWDELRLAEMSAVSAVRDKLINEGKYLKACKDFYRILTPSENYEQAKFYEQQADRKLARGRKLINNTPRLADEKPSNAAARLLLKEGSISRPRAY